MRRYPDGQDSQNATPDAQDRGQPKIENAALFDVPKPKKLSQTLEEAPADCLACRLTGTAAFLGLGAYVYQSGMKSLNAQALTLGTNGARLGYKSRVLSLTLLSGSIVGLGLYRLVN